MDPCERKLAVLLDDAELARDLVVTGYRLPRQIREAKDGDLDKAVGETKRQKIRGRFSKAESVLEPIPEATPAPKRAARRPKS